MAQTVQDFSLSNKQVSENTRRSIASTDNALGEGTDRTQELGTEAMDRVLATLIDFAGKIKDHDVSEIKFVATSAVRDARNRDIFLMAAEEVTTIKPEILDGSDEARFTFLGATNSISSTGPSLVIDIGGGSTEFAFGEGELEFSHSADIGCVRISERFIANDPPLPEELSAAQSLIDLHPDDVLMDIPSISQQQTYMVLQGR